MIQAQTVFSDGVIWLYTLTDNYYNIVYVYYISYF